MRSVSVRLADLQRVTIPIGYVGENLYTKVIVDCKTVFDEHPTAVVGMTVEPPEGDPYPAIVTRDGDFVIWEVSASDLVYKGAGNIQISFTVDSTIVGKSPVGRIMVNKSIVPDGEAPEALDDFLTRASTILNEIPEDIAEALQEAKDSGEFDGADGVSPTVTVTTITGGHQITITDANGDHIYTVMDGQDGQDGQDGNDGVSPTVSVSDITGGHRVTIVDAEGTHTFDVMDGHDGDPSSIIDDTSTANNKVWSANKVNDLKSAITQKQDAPSTAGTSGQVLGLNAQLEPEWKTVSGGGTVDSSLSTSSENPVQNKVITNALNDIKGSQISCDEIDPYTENLIGAFTDGKFATGISTQGSSDLFATATADITGYSEIILSSYILPSNTSYPFVFYGNGNVQSTGGITEYETVGTKTYKVHVPTGSDHVHINVYASDKSSAVVKGITDTRKELAWLKLSSDNLTQDVIEDIAEQVAPSLEIIPTQIVGEKELFGGETPSGTTTESGFYQMKGKGVQPTFDNNLQHLEVPVVPGMIIKTYVGANIDVIQEGNKNNYFCVVDENGKCTDAFDVTIDENYVYTFRIPDDGETCYITITGTIANAYAHAYEDEFKLEWLNLVSGNFKDNTVPESAIIKNNNNSYIHGEVIEKPFNFNNKTIALFGDSIASGIANEGSGNISAGSNKWASLFCTHVGATLASYAVGGATIAYRANEQYASVYAQVTAYTGQADFIMIAGGTNDYNQGVDVGQYGDNTEYTTYGALKLICEYLKTNYSTTPVFFITPINVMKNILGIDRSLLNKYRNAIYEVATSYGHNVINGIDLVPVVGNTTWDNEFITYGDGTHPTLKGHAMYYRNMCMKLL